MWIEISSDTFVKAEFKSLNFLYQILSWYPSDSSSRYEIFVNTELVKNTNNYKQLKSIEADLDLFLDTQFNDFVTSQPQNAIKDYTVTYRKSRTFFEVEEAIQFFNQPVLIILENNKNDSAFVLAIIEYFGKENSINKSKTHYENNWIRFENAGGCKNIPNVVESFLKSFEQLALKNKRHRSDYFRGLIIIDSDREYDNQPSKHDATLLRLNNLGIINGKIHILKKRMMENYLPNGVFEELRTKYQRNPQVNKDLINWINVYLSLPLNSQGLNEKQNYLNIQKGKLHGSETPVPVDLTTLYTLSKAQFDILNAGFKLESFKNKFPLLFLSSSVVNKFTLTQRCENNELQEIMDKINQLI